MTGDLERTWLEIEGYYIDMSETEQRSITRGRRSFRQTNLIIQNPQIQSSNRVRQADIDRSRDRNRVV